MVSQDSFPIVREFKLPRPHFMGDRLSQTLSRFKRRK
jgi:hypothetical protein